jgi:hypothetical protein
MLISPLPVSPIKVFTELKYSICSSKVLKFSAATISHPKF